MCIFCVYTLMYLLITFVSVEMCDSVFMCDMRRFVVWRCTYVCSVSKAWLRSCHKPRRICVHNVSWFDFNLSIKGRCF
jgi:hypothetical protein